MKKLIRPIGYLLVLIVSTGLLAYAWWLWQIERGSRAALTGDAGAAPERFSLAEAPVNRFPWLARLVKDDYQRLIFNHVALLYAREEMDKATAKLEQAAAVAPFLAESGEYSFWTGNILLQRAIQSKNPEATISNLKSALAEYQRGLTFQPEDWDLKYNYDLVKHILTQRDQDSKKEEKVKSILEKMRPAMEPSQENIPAQKRG